VPDTALRLDICSGPDPRDRTCLPSAHLRYRELTEALPVSGLRADLSLDLGFIPVDPEVGAIVEEGKAARLPGHDVAADAADPDPAKRAVEQLASPAHSRPASGRSIPRTG
jgi:hypothetical protein